MPARMVPSSQPSAGADELAPSQPPELTSPTFINATPSVDRQPVESRSNGSKSRQGEASPRSTSASAQPSRVASTSSSACVQALLDEAGPSSRDSLTATSPPVHNKAGISSSARQCASPRGADAVVQDVSDERERVGRGASPPRAQPRPSPASNARPNPFRQSVPRAQTAEDGMSRLSSPLSSPPAQVASRNSPTAGGRPAGDRLPHPTASSSSIQQVTNELPSAPLESQRAASSSSAGPAPSVRRPSLNPFARSVPPPARPAVACAPLQVNETRRQAILEAAADLGSPDGSDAEDELVSSVAEPMQGVLTAAATTDPDRSIEGVPDDVDEADDEDDDPMLLKAHTKNTEDPTELRQLIVIRKALEALENMERYEDDLEDINAVHHQLSHCRADIQVDVNPDLDVSVSYSSRYPDRFAAARAEPEQITAAKRPASSQSRPASHQPSKRRRASSSATASRKQQPSAQRTTSVSSSSSQPIASTSKHRSPRPAQPAVSETLTISSQAAVPKPDRPRAGQDSRLKALSLPPNRKVPDLDLATTRAVAKDVQPQTQAVVSLDSDDPDSASDYDDHGRPTYRAGTRGRGPLEFACVLIPRSSHTDDVPAQAHQGTEKVRASTSARRPSRRSPQPSETSVANESAAIDSPASGFRPRRKGKRSKGSQGSSFWDVDGVSGGSPLTADPDYSDTSSDVIVFDPRSYSDTNETDLPISKAKPVINRSKGFGYVHLTEITGADGTITTLRPVDDYFLRTDLKGKPLDSKRWSIKTVDNYSELVPYDHPVPSASADAGGGPSSKPSAFKRGRFEDRPRKTASIGGTSSTLGRPLGARRRSLPASVSSRASAPAKTEAVQLRAGRIAKRPVFDGDDDYSGDAASEFSVSTSRSAVPARIRRVPSRPKAARPPPQSDTYGQTGHSTNCHQCRRTTTFRKARCTRCDRRYCEPCLDSRYGIDYLLLDRDSFLCAACQDHCNCSICLGRYGYRGRVDAFRGLPIRLSLHTAIKGTEWTCTKDMLDSKVEQAGGLDAWTALEGSDDMAIWLKIGSLGADDSGPSLSTRAHPQKRAKSRLRGGDDEVDLATILSKKTVGKGKGKAVDSDGETVDEPDDDGHEPDQPVDVERQLLANGPEYLIPHLIIDDHDDEPDHVEGQEHLPASIIRHFSADQLASSSRSTAGLDALAEAAAQDEHEHGPAHSRLEAPQLIDDSLAFQHYANSAPLFSHSGPDMTLADRHESLLSSPERNQGDGTPSSGSLHTPDTFVDGLGLLRHDGDSGASDDELEAKSQPRRSHSIHAEYDAISAEYAESPMTLPPQSPWDTTFSFDEDVAMIAGPDELEYGVDM